MMAFKSMLENMYSDKRKEYAEIKNTQDKLEKVLSLYVMTRVEVFKTAQKMLINAQTAALSLMRAERNIENCNVNEAIMQLEKTVDYILKVYLPEREAIAKYYDVSADDVFIKLLKGEVVEKSALKKNPSCPTQLSKDTTFKELFSFFYYFMFRVYSDYKFKYDCEEYLHAYLKNQQKLEIVLNTGLQVKDGLGKVNV